MDAGAPQASPEGRFGAAEAYDPQTKTVMLFGGRLEPGTPVHDTWAWKGTTWGPSTAVRAVRLPARDRTWPGTPRSIR